MAWIPLAAAAVSAASSFFGQKDTNDANQAMSREQMEFNAQQADITRSFNASQGDLGRVFASQEAEEARAFSNEQAAVGRNFNASEAALQRAWSSGEAATLRDFSADQAAQLRAWQEVQAENQRVWSERMSASSYQRAVGDLQKAGLNPMLAYSQGGAPMPVGSVPSGAMGSGSLPSGSSASGSGGQSFMGSSGNASGPSASYGSLPARQNAAQVATQSAVQSYMASIQGENIAADTKLKEAQADQSLASAQNVRTQTDRIVQGEIPKLREEIAVMSKSLVNMEDQRLLLQAQTELTRVSRFVEEGRIKSVAASAALDEVSARLKQLAIPEAEAYSEKFKSSFGKDLTPYLRETLDILRVLIYGRAFDHR